MENSCGMCGRLWRAQGLSVWWVGYSVLLFIGLGSGAFGGNSDDLDIRSCSANIAITYKDPTNGNSRLETAEMGRYGWKSPCESEWGSVVHVRTAAEGANHGCTPLNNVPSKGRWIALVQRGECKFHDKIVTAAVVHNASAVVVYNNVISEPNFGPITMDHDGKLITPHAL